MMNVIETSLNNITLQIYFSRKTAVFCRMYFAKTFCILPPCGKVVLFRRISLDNTRIRHYIALKRNKKFINDEYMV